MATQTGNPLSRLLRRYPKLKSEGMQHLVMLVPFCWIGLFIIGPLALILKISFSESITAIPPYSPLVEWVNAAHLRLSFHLSNYLMLIEDWLYIDAYISSLLLAGGATIFCLLMGYPMAYGIARAPYPWRIVMLMLVILPFWTSFLIRIYAWVGLLSTHGIINSFLLKLKLIEAPLPLLNNNFAVCLGLVYCYLPFMILPLYATLEKMDRQILEAASDLGCRPLKAFMKITLPLSLPGIIAGSILVFIPCVGEFVVPELLGGSDNVMIGRVLWNEFFHNGDWPVAAAVAIALLILLVIPMMIFQRLHVKGGGG